MSHFLMGVAVFKLVWSLISSRLLVCLCVCSGYAIISTVVWYLCGLGCCTLKARSSGCDCCCECFAWLFTWCAERERGTTALLDKCSVSRSVGPSLWWSFHYSLIFPHPLFSDIASRLSVLPFFLIVNTCFTLACLFCTYLPPDIKNIQSQTSNKGYISVHYVVWFFVFCGGFFPSNVSPWKVFYLLLTHTGKCSFFTHKWFEFPGQPGLWPGLWGFQGRSLAEGLHWACLTGVGLLLYRHACYKCRSGQELLRKLEEGDCTHSRFFVNLQTPQKGLFPMLIYASVSLLKPSGQIMPLALHIFCCNSFSDHQLPDICWLLSSMALFRI